MKISARVDSSFGKHAVTRTTDGAARELAIPPRADGGGASATNGEPHRLALATRYCNDLYREAKKSGIELIRHTDTVTEIQNTIRRSCPVTLTGIEAHEAL